MIPLFCKEKDTQRTTSGPVGIGALQIPTADASSWFTAGEWLFISESDGTEVEYLGTIVAVAADSVTVELATAAAKAAGAAVWTPSTVFVWPVGRDVSVAAEKETGVEVLRSLGGAAYAARLHAPYTVESVRFENLTDGRFSEFAAWLEQKADDGIEEITYVSASRTVWRARVVAPALKWERTSKDLVALGFELHLLAESEYA